MPLTDSAVLLLHDLPIYCLLLLCKPTWPPLMPLTRGLPIWMSLQDSSASFWITCSGAVQQRAAGGTADEQFAAGDSATTTPALQAVSCACFFPTVYK